MYEIHAAGYLTLRIVLAQWLFFAAWRRWKTGLKAYAHYYAPLFKPFGFSAPILQGLLGLATFIEVIAAVLLFLGAWKWIALLLLAPYFIIQAIAWSIVTPYWDPRHFFPRLIIYFLLTVLPMAWDLWSLDNWLHLTDFHHP